MIAKKIVALFIVIIFLTTVGFGCKGLSSDQQQAIKSVSLEYWTVNDDVDELNKMIAKFRGSRSYITIDVRQLREDELYTRFVEALAEDKGPDIISVPVKHLASYRSKLSPMPATARDATLQVIKKKLGSEIQVNVNNVVLPGITQLDQEYVQTVKKDVVYKNEIYGLPISLDTMALYYNKDLLDRAGIAEPPQSWTDFQLAVKKLTKTDSDGNLVQSGAAIGTSNNIEGFEDLLYLLFEQSGIKFTDTNGYAIFNPPNMSETSPVLQVMNFYTDFADPTRDTYTWDKSNYNSLTEFVRGNTAFFFGYSYNYKTIKAQAPQLNVAVVPMLQLSASTPTNVANYWLQTVPLKSENKNEAWALINYLTHSKETKTYLDNTKRPTALRTYINEQKKDPLLQPFVSQILVANNWYRGTSYSTAKSALDDMVTQWHLVGDQEENPNVLYGQIMSRAASRINSTIK